MSRCTVCMRLLCLERGECLIPRARGSSGRSAAEGHRDPSGEETSTISFTNTLIDIIHAAVICLYAPSMFRRYHS